MAFLAEDFAQAGKEGEANGLHGWDNAHTVYNDCVSIVVDHVESPFYWSDPGKDWRLQPGLFNVCLVTSPPLAAVVSWEFSHSQEGNNYA
ncbi:hypothetical protein [Serratia sp. CY47612]|uniref:hypothetical protein n=1 Tax=Serratia sp. CY47612 TaxID=3383627 RepID=UPI003FA03EE6